MKLFRSPNSRPVPANNSSSDGGTSIKGNYNRSSSSSNNTNASSPRRRNFRFLRSVDQKKRTSVATQQKTRAHARELAMAYNSNDASDTPTSTTSSNVNLLSRQDATSPSPTKQTEPFFDPFGNNNNNTSLLDQHFDAGFSTMHKERTPSFDTASMSSDLDLFSTNGKPAKLDDFMGRQQQRERNVISMPPSSTGSKNNSNNVNAMARRRVRNQNNAARQSSDISVSSNYSDGSQLSDNPEGGGSFKVRKPKIGSSAGSVTGSVYSQTSATYASTTSEQQNFWDMDRQDGGFTFDAFGLDASKVEQDVNDAMQELVTAGMRGFSFFDSDQESEFAPFDSPNTSRLSDDIDDDGFRVQQPQQQQQQPTRGQSPQQPRGQTPPRWEKPKQQQPQNGKVAFADFDNPWKEDPFSRAGQQHYATSEIGASSEFGGPKSEFLPVASAYAPSPFSANKSDHGVTGHGYLSKLSSPNVTTNQRRRPSKLDLHHHHDHGEVDSEDDGMQDELAREFAQEFVKRITPRSAAASPSSHSERSYASESSCDDSEYDQQQQHVAPTPTPKVSNSLTPKSKFRNFRDRYESTKEEAAASSSTPTATPPVQSYRARAAAQRGEDDNTISHSPLGESSSSASGRKSSSYGSLRSSYNAAKTTTATPPPLPPTRPPSYGRPVEEKKDDEEEPPDLPKRGTLKAKWQKFEKAKPQVPAPAPPARPGRKSPIPTKEEQQDVVLDESDAESIEIMSSSHHSVENSSSTGRFGHRGSDINKSAFSRLRAESSPQPAESTPAPFLKNVTLRRTVSKPKMEDLVGDDDVDDVVPDSPPPRNARPVSYRQQQQKSTIEQSRSCHERLQTPSSPLQQEKEEKPVEEKLTYRERRELELQREAQEKLKKSPQKQDMPKKDVAALIRRRIAANKQKSTEEKEESSGGELSNFRNRLKPVNSSRPASPEPEQQPTTKALPASPERNPMNAAKPAEDDKTTPLSAGKFRYATESEKDLPARPSSGGQAESPLNEFMQQNKSQNKGSLLDHETVVSLQAENADLQAKLKELENKLAAKEKAPTALTVDTATTAAEDHHKMLGGMLAKRLSPTAKNASTGGNSATAQDPKSMLGNMLAARGAPAASGKKDDDKAQDPKSMLGNMLAARGASGGGKKDDKAQDPKSMLGNMLAARGAPEAPKKEAADVANSGGRPALKDDPKYEKYFKMMKVGMPKEMVKHAMQRDGLDPDLLDEDPNKPAGLPLKEDPKYQKYFKMLKIGIPMDQVKHALERDGLNPGVMDQDHNLPAAAAEKKIENKKKEPKKKDTHRRARLHWKTVKKVVRNSIWGKIETDESMSCIDIDEDEFQHLFQAEIGKSVETPKNDASEKKGPSVRCIDSKRANNGGIILARIKMSHDDMADAVDRMDSECFTAGQIENIIEYLPNKDEREKLENYMIQGEQDAAEKFNGLCECEKFMVSMMTVKHAKRKVNALLFKLQFSSCLESIAADADMIDQACDELKQSERLRHLLGIVLQFGNRLNTAGSGEKHKAGAFTLDSLLKLNQAKAFDKKTTFLNYIVLIVQRNNERLLDFADDLPTVAKAEKVFWDQCISDLEDVETQLENVRRISLHEAKSKSPYRTNKKKENGNDDDSVNDDLGMSLEEEVAALRSTQTGLFTLSAIKQVSALRDKVDATVVKYQKLLEYFGEDESGSKQPHELFAIFSKFSADFSKAKEEVFRKQKKMQREERKKQREAEKAQGKPPTQPKSVSSSQQGNGAQDRSNGISGSKSRSTEAAKTWPKVSTGLPRPDSFNGDNSVTDDSEHSENDPKSSAKANFRDQARHRRLRQMQATGKAPAGTPPKPTISNSSMNRTPPGKYPPIDRSPIKSPSPVNGLRSTTGTPPPKPPMPSSTTPTGSRNLMRNRRRLMEERKKRSTPTDKSSPWQHSPQTAN